MPSSFFRLHKEISIFPVLYSWQPKLLWNTCTYCFTQNIILYQRLWALTGTGCPSRTESIFLKFSNSASCRKPASAQTEYKIGAAWPFERTNRSLLAFLGSCTLYLMVWKNSTDIISAALQHDVGWLQVKKTQDYHLCYSLLRTVSLKYNFIRPQLLSIKPHKSEVSDTPALWCSPVPISCTLRQGEPLI